MAVVVIGIVMGTTRETVIVIVIVIAVVTVIELRKYYGYTLRR